jgi:hypothetical protein
MISATTLSNYNNPTVGLQSLGETEPPTVQASAVSTPPSIQLAAAKADSAQADLAAITSNSSLPQMLDTVVSMLQNLMKMIQGLLVGPNTSDREPSAIPTLNPGMPSEEPPTVIPVAPFNPTPQTITVPPTKTGTTNNSVANDSAQTTSTKSTQDTQGTAKTRATRTKATKGAKRRKSAKNSMNGQGQFLWKPKSEKDGKLAVLLPKQYTGKVASVEVLSPDGQQKLAQGKASGVGNGDREHFRFNSPGEAFPDGSIVFVTLKDGSTSQVEIKNTSARFTR